MPTWYPPQATAAAAPPVAPHVAPPAQPAAPVANGPMLYTYKPAGSAPAQPAPVAPAPVPAPTQPVAAVPVAVPGPYYILQPANTYYYGYGYGIPRTAPATAGNGAANPYVWRGLTKHEVDTQNLRVARNVGATQPRQLVPADAQPGQMWWVRELDGSWTLRNTHTIQNALQPGFWSFAPHGGYPYFTRQAAQ
ncbi:MAG: hypothetical protein M1816_002568 [Peltula sp. TS41687]|nr:MAG: hypothetical protein M1816_002568 [Peltula sp. TS41687]